MHTRASATLSGSVQFWTKSDFVTPDIFPRYEHVRQNNASVCEYGSTRQTRSKTKFRSGIFVILPCAGYMATIPKWWPKQKTVLYQQLQTTDCIGAPLHNGKNMVICP